MKRTTLVLTILTAALSAGCDQAEREKLAEERERAAQTVEEWGEAAAAKADEWKETAATRAAEWGEVAAAKADEWKETAATRASEWGEVAAAKAGEWKETAANAVAPIFDGRTVWRNGEKSASEGRREEARDNE